MKKSSLINSVIYNESKPAISVLFESDTSKEIRIVFKKGQFMKAHQTSFPITVEIFEGAINFGVNGTVHNLVKGDLVALDASISHDLHAVENSIVRLTLAKLDTVDRVIKVTKN